MVFRCCRVGLAVLAGFLLFLSGCAPKHVKQLGPFPIGLSYNNGSCQQNGSSGVIDVPSDQSVTYQGAIALNQFQLQFSSCPFESCPITSNNGAPANAGQPKPGTANNTYYYSSITINGQQCNGVQSMGVRIRGGP